MANAESVKGAPKGWFVLPDQDGDRTVEQQMLGLEPLLAMVRGKTVLDIGTAEGLVAFELARAGAAGVLGVDILNRHIDVANRLNWPPALPCRFEQGDATTYEPRMQYDIVLMLSVLHKLPNPSDACETLAAAAKELCVIRLPPGKGVIVDARSMMVPHDIVAVMHDSGFELDQVTHGPFDEWCGIFRRLS